MDDLCDVQDEVLVKLELKPPYVLMGQSGGGNVAIWCARRHPERVAALIAIEAGHDEAAEIQRWIEEDGFVCGGRSNPEHMNWCTAAVWFDGMKMPIGNFPVRILSGTDPGAAKDQRFWLNLSPNSRQVVIEGGHNLQWDAPDRVLTEIEKLLAH